MTMELAALEFERISRDIHVNANARVLHVTPLSGSRKGKKLTILTLGHERADLEAASAQGTQDALPSILFSIVSGSSRLVLPPPWRCYSEWNGVDANAALYRTQLHHACGADDLNTTLSPHVLALGRIASPLRAQPLDAVRWHDGQEPAPRTYSQALLAPACRLVDPVLLRPLGATQLLSGPSIVGGSVVQLDNAPAAQLPPTPTPLPPLYIPSFFEASVMFWKERNGFWSDERERIGCFMKGPAQLANQIITAYLDAKHVREQTPEAERVSLEWVRGGGQSAPIGGNTGGRPDFVLEHRHGGRTANLVTGAIKTFVGSSLLVALLRPLIAGNSLDLFSSRRKRPAWVKFLTRLAFEMARAGASCGLLWTGLDFIVVDREQDEDGKMQLRVWPKLLRSTTMREAVTEEGLPLEEGKTRHDASPNAPTPEEEECELSEAGVLVGIAFRALQRHQSGIRFDPKPLTVKLPEPIASKRVPALRREDPSSDGSRHKRRRLDSSGPGEDVESNANADVNVNVSFASIEIGSGAVATVHHAWRQTGPEPVKRDEEALVIKLARILPLPDEAWAWPQGETGPDSFAAAARRYLSREVTAYQEAEAVQGSVLPVFESLLEADGSQYGEDEGGGTSTSGDSAILSPSTDGGQDPQLAFDDASLATSPPVSVAYGGATSTVEDDASPVAQSPSTADWPPYFVEGVIMTLVGKSLRSLLGETEGQGGRTALRELLSSAGLADADAAALWLRESLEKALGQIHSCGVAHGDVSAGNVCLDSPSPSADIAVRLVDLSHAVLAREVSADEFEEAVAEDLAEARRLVRGAVAQAWGEELCDESESE